VHAAVVADGAVEWQARPDPVPGAHEILVRVDAAGLNAADLLQRAGHYPPPPGAPADIPGLECAGTVVGLGPGVERFTIGDRVMGLLGGGGQAELAVLHERVALAVPTSVSTDAAGAFCEVFATAYDALFTQGHLCSGERLLVNGGAGGVGVAAVQLARATGASVVASVRDAAKRASVAELGAVVVAPDATHELAPYDVVLELVGAPNLATNLADLETGGRVIVIGTGAGRTAELDLGIVMARRATIRGSTLRSRPLEEKAMLSRALERHVLPLLASGRISVPIEQRFAFADVASAYERFAAGSKLGKILLATHSTSTATT
jgi:putative PIG3 family NAD(P)H quinone oxidoreductase